MRILRRWLNTETFLPDVRRVAGQFGNSGLTLRRSREIDILCSDRVDHLQSGMPRERSLRIAAAAVPRGCWLSVIMRISAKT